MVSVVALKEVGNVKTEIVNVLREGSEALHVVTNEFTPDEDISANASPENKAGSSHIKVKPAGLSGSRLLYLRRQASPRKALTLMITH